MNQTRPQTVIKWIATIAGLALLTIILVFLSLDSLFAAGTFPNDPKEQRIGLVWAFAFFLAAVAIVVIMGRSIIRFRRQLRIQHSPQGFPVITKEPSAIESTTLDKKEEISN